MPTPLNAAVPALPHLRDGERLVPLLTQTEAALVAYENTSPDAAFEGDNVKEALDTLFQRMPVLSGNGKFIFKAITPTATASTYTRTSSWTVPQGVYECVCLVLAPGRYMAPNSSPVPGGYAVSFRMPVSPGTKMNIALVQVNNRQGNVAATAVYARILLADNAAVGCCAYASDSTRWSLTFPGAELLFAKKGGDGMHSASSSSAQGHNGGGFRIKDADLLDFALNGGTDAYGTPTNATASAHGTSVWGPSGALTNMDGTSSGLPDGYCGGFGYAPVTDVNCSNSLVALFWGPQIRA